MSEIKKQDILLLNVGSTAVGAKVTAFAGANGDEISFELMNPVCCEIGEKIAITRKIEKSWRLIGWGKCYRG